MEHYKLAEQYTLKVGIIYNMKLTREQTQTIIDNGKLKGFSGESVLNGLISRGYEPEGIDVEVVKKTLVKSTKPTSKEQPEPTFGQRVVADIKEAGDKISDTIASNEGSAVSRGFQATATAFNTIPKLAYEALPEQARKAIDFVGEKTGEAVNNIVDKISDNPKLQEFMKDVPENNGGEELLKVLGSSAEIAGDILAVAGATKTANKTVDVTKNVANKIKTNIENLPNHPILAKIPNSQQKISDFFSKDVDGKASTILKETPTDKFDQYLKVAEEAVNDPRKITPIGVVGDKTADATKQLVKQIKSESIKKKAIITKAKVGLDDFTKETGSTILDVNRSLKGTKIGEQVISKLKKVKTKLDADNIIDEIQDMVYKGNKDMTIPMGSAEDKILRGILGKYNGKLKATLPKSYSVLNDSISSKLKVVSTLNKALGEVVDGVSTRGAGLVKQFFSPAGRKTQELFQYIKENTGIDLAQDATLAKFAMEMFEDARSKALLEGIPTSAGGVVNTAIDAVVKHSGVGQGLQNKLRDSTIKKARKLTIPKK